jgi:hypothetical protein
MRSKVALDFVSFMLPWKKIRKRDKTALENKIPGDDENIDMNKIITIYVFT